MEIKNGIKTALKLVKDIENGPYGWASLDYIFSFFDLTFEEKYLACFMLAIKGRLKDFGENDDLEDEPSLIITPKDFMDLLESRQ